MKRLNEKQFETMKWSLTGTQLEVIKAKGEITLNKQQMLDTLKREIKETEEMRTEVEKYLNKAKNETEKEMMNKCIEGGKARVKDMQELINTLENDDEEYEMRFMRGAREL